MVTNLRMYESLDMLLPSNMISWIVSTEKRQKNIPTPKDIRPERIILRAVVPLSSASKTAPRRKVIGVDMRMMTFLLDE